VFFSIHGPPAYSGQNTHSAWTDTHTQRESSGFLHSPVCRIVCPHLLCCFGACALCACMVHSLCVNATHAENATLTLARLPLVLRSISRDFRPDSNSSPIPEQGAHGGSSRTAQMAE
jgi:hypothetical protein